jgi:hypothetical protein
MGGIQQAAEIVSLCVVFAFLIMSAYFLEEVCNMVSLGSATFLLHAVPSFAENKNDNK